MSDEETLARPSFAAQIRQASRGSILLLRGMDQGEPAWYYLRLHDGVKQTLLEGRLAFDRSEIPLDEYGEVLHSGWGESPPEDVQHLIHTLYGDVS